MVHGNSFVPRAKCYENEILDDSTLLPSAASHLGIMNCAGLISKISE